MVWYKDWQFWALIPAFVAVVLSQVPPIRLWLRKRKLSVQIHRRAMINHHVGIPQIQIFVMLRNVGGRSIYLDKIEVDITTNGRTVFCEEATTFFDGPSAKDAVLFVPFDLTPGARWTNMVNFGRILDRAEERKFRAEQAALRTDIAQKLKENAAKDPPVEEVVFADEATMAPLLDRFGRYFIWEPGDYQLKLRMLSGANVLSESSYRFVIFEADATELKAIKDKYNMGSGVVIDLPTQPIYVPLEVVN